MKLNYDVMDKNSIQLNFHPLHYEDLKKSGLSDETIEKAQIQSVPPDKLKHFVPSGLLKHVTSVYSIPYHDAKGRGINFYRLKCFYLNEGKFPKYLQPEGTGNRLYFPPILKQDKLLNASEPLYITEGEKKALKGAQEGLTCVGLSGLWNWSNGKKELIDDFNQIPLKDRKVVIVPDNDYKKPNKHGYAKNLEQAVYEFAKKLAERGAIVFVKELPDAEEKIGLDDYLVNHTVLEFQALSEKELSFKPPLQEVEEKIEQTNIYNWRVLIPEIQALNSVEKEHAIGKLAKQLKISKEVLRKELAHRKDKDKHEKLMPFAEIEPYPEPVGIGIFEEIENFLRNYVVLQHYYYPVIATWIIASYLFENFTVFPYLLITSPIKRCGKTQLLEVLSHLSNKAILSCSISSASIYRLVDEYKPTLIIDEADRFLWKNEELIGVLNAGYQKGIPVIRTNPNTLEPEIFDPYCPKVIAMIRKHTDLLDTLLDRAIEIKMQRKKISEKVKMINKEFYEKAQVIRAKILRFITDTMIEEHEIKIPEINNDRAIKHWRPLFLVSSYGSDEFQKSMEEAFLTTEQKVEDCFEIELLKDIYQIFCSLSTDKILTRNLLLKLHSLEIKPYRDLLPTPHKLAKVLDRFGIKSKNMRIGEARGNGYYKNDFNEVFARYIYSNLDNLDKQVKLKDYDKNENLTKGCDVKLSNSTQSLENTDLSSLSRLQVINSVDLIKFSKVSDELEEVKKYIPNYEGFLKKLKNVMLLN